MASVLDRPKLVTEGRSPRHAVGHAFTGASEEGRSWYTTHSFPGAGATPDDGVPDMTVISDIDEFGINTNLKVRYKRDQIYVSVGLYKSKYMR